MPIDETREELIRQLFYLITVAAEEAATLAIKGQSPNFEVGQKVEAAIGLQDIGKRIEILSSAIAELCQRSA